MKLWLDDIRDPASHGRLGWTWVTTVADAIALLSTGEVTEASLDHDLAFEHYVNGTLYSGELEKTGYHVVCWMEEHNVWPENGVHVHSMNPVGARRMRDVIDRHYNKELK